MALSLLARSALQANLAGRVFESADVLLVGLLCDLRGVLHGYPLFFGDFLRGSIFPSRRR